MVLVGHGGGAAVARRCADPTKESTMQPHSPQAARRMRIGQDRPSDEHDRDAPPAPTTPPAAMLMALVFVAVVVLVLVLL
jgi:hypothetical protein